MLQVFKHYINTIDKINDFIGKIAGWLATLMVLIICFDVSAKFIASKLDLSYSNTAIYELQWHLFAFVFLLGTAYTLRHDRHVRVDLFYSKFSDKTKAWVNILGVVFFLMPFCIIVMKTSLLYVKNSYLMMEKSPDPGGLPYRFILKGTIIFAFGLLSLQGLAMLLRSVVVLLNKEDELTPASRV